jgi:hypothetical protein
MRLPFDFQDRAAPLASDPWHARAVPEPMQRTGVNRHLARCGAIGELSAAETRRAAGERERVDVPDRGGGVSLGDRPSSHLVAAVRRVFAPHAIVAAVVLRRSSPRPRLQRLDRWLIATLATRTHSLLEAVMVVRPATVLRWHRAAWRLWWRWRSNRRRPAADRRRVAHPHPAYTCVGSSDCTVVRARGAGCRPFARRCSRVDIGRLSGS